MRAKFNNCIALGVADKEAAAARFVECFEAEITKRADDWIEVTAPPYKLYFVEDGTKDIAFSVDVPKDELEDKVAQLMSSGFPIDETVSAKTRETFVRDIDGILVNVYPV